MHALFGIRSLAKRAGISHNKRMPSTVQVTVHPSQFPGPVEQALLASLRSRRMDHRFLYKSLKQTQKWLALHEALSPARTDPDCAAIYERSAAAVTGRVRAEAVHVIGLGCGGGQKETRLLRELVRAGREVFYTAVDVGVGMVVVAREAAGAVVAASRCSALVCDLGSADDLPVVLDQVAPAGAGAAARLLTFFGMLPNFEPGTILPRLASLVRAGDSLWVSANLAPGPDYAAGVNRILPLYDNDLTRDWLLTVLLDLGVERGDGALDFVIEDDPAGFGLKRVAAYFRFTGARSLQAAGERVEFRAGEAMRLFFSYRHTPALVESLLRPCGLRILDQWIAPSEEEGVFLAVPGRDYSPAPQDS